MKQGRIQDLGCQSGAAPVTSEIVGSIPGQTHSSCDKEGDSLWQRRFPSGLRCPNIFYRANNVLGSQFNILIIWGKERAPGASR
jgi:hypothetical protein